MITNVHIGDNVDHDAAGPALAGMRSLWLVPGDVPLPDGYAAPEAVIRDLPELPVVLGRLHGQPRTDT